MLNRDVMMFVCYMLFLALRAVAGEIAVRGCVTGGWSGGVFARISMRKMIAMHLSDLIRSTKKVSSDSLPMNWHHAVAANSLEILICTPSEYGNHRAEKRISRLWTSFFAAARSRSESLLTD